MPLAFDRHHPVGMVEPGLSDGGYRLKPGGIRRAHLRYDLSLALASHGRGLSMHPERAKLCHAQ